jgi:hypothetical protein
MVPSGKASVSTDSCDRTDFIDDLLCRLRYRSDNLLQYAADRLRFVVDGDDHRQHGRLYRLSGHPRLTTG